MRAYDCISSIISRSSTCFGRTVIGEGVPERSDDSVELGEVARLERDGRAVVCCQDNDDLRP